MAQPYTLQHEVSAFIYIYIYIYWWWDPHVFIRELCRLLGGVCYEGIHITLGIYISKNVMSYNLDTWEYKYSYVWFNWEFKGVWDSYVWCISRNLKRIIYFSHTTLKFCKSNIIYIYIYIFLCIFL